MQIAQPLKVARAAANWTQAQLAEVAGVTTTTLSHIENGLVQPKKLTRRRIETALAAAVDWKRTFDDGQINYKPQQKNGQPKQLTNEE